MTIITLLTVCKQWYIARPAVLICNCILWCIIYIHSVMIVAFISEQNINDLIVLLLLEKINSFVMFQWDLGRISACYKLSTNLHICVHPVVAVITLCTQISCPSLFECYMFSYFFFLLTCALYNFFTIFQGWVSLLVFIAIQYNILWIMERVGCGGPGTVRLPMPDAVMSSKF